MGWAQAITAVASFFSELFTLGYKVAKLWKEAQLKGWVKDGVKLSAAIDGAKTEDERALLAKLLFQHRAE